MKRIENNRETITVITTKNKNNNNNKTVTDTDTDKDTDTDLIGRLGEGLVVRTISSTYCLTIKVLDPSMSAIAPSVSTIFPVLCTFVAL